MNKKAVLTLSTDQVHSIHEQITRKSGGLAGSCVDRPLESVLFRVENHLLYGNHSGLHEVAALYAYAMATGHPFNDGNKRTAMVVMLVF